MSDPDELNAEPAQPLKGQTRKPPKKKSTDELRQQRVKEYEAKGLRNPEPFEACLAAIQADQIRVSFSMKHVLQQIFADAQASLESIPDMERVLNLYLRVTRQIERYGQLQIRQAELQQAQFAAASVTLPKEASDKSSEPRRPALK